MKKTKTLTLPPQPSGHDLNVGDIVYVAMEDKFAKVTAKYYRFEPRTRRGVRFETETPELYNPRQHRRNNDLLTVQSLETSFHNGMMHSQFDSFHIHLADASFRARLVYDTIAAVNDRLNRLAKKVGVA